MPLPVVLRRRNTVLNQTQHLIILDIVNSEHPTESTKGSVTRYQYCIDSSLYLKLILSIPKELNPHSKVPYNAKEVSAVFFLLRRRFRMTILRTIELTFLAPYILIAYLFFVMLMKIWIFGGFEP